MRVTVTNQRFNLKCSPSINLGSQAVLLSAYIATYNHQVLKGPGLKLERGRGVFISTPRNGWCEKAEYDNSGKMTANTVKAALSRISDNVYIAEDGAGGNI